MIFNNYIRQISLIFSIILITTGCSSSGDEGGENQPKNPEAAVLIFPIKDAECNEGTIISETQSDVTFEWNAAANAQLYTLTVTNLLDNTSRDFPSSTTSKKVTLERGTPYSWSVVSKSNATANTATSDSWRFYNAGPGVENYAPFPAGLLNPILRGMTTTAPTLSWSSIDIDNDISNYQVYVDTINPPVTLAESTSNTSIDISNLASNTVYYWQVVTNDDHGNSSKSLVFEFETQ